MVRYRKPRHSRRSKRKTGRRIGVLGKKARMGVTSRRFQLFLVALVTGYVAYVWAQTTRPVTRSSVNQAGQIPPPAEKPRGAALPPAATAQPQPSYAQSCYEPAKNLATKHYQQQMIAENTLHAQELRRIRDFYASRSQSGSSYENASLKEEYARHREVVSSANGELAAKLQNANCQ